MNTSESPRAENQFNFKTISNITQEINNKRTDRYELHQTASYRQ